MTTRTDAKSIWITGIVAAAVAAGLNALLVILSTTIFGLNADGLFLPLTGPAPVIMFTVISLLLATLVFWIISRRSDQPLATFRTIAIAVLLLSFLPDLWLLTQPVASWPEVIVLMLTHVVAAAVIYGAFARRVMG
ncbi:MAG: DUF6069 family protein [Thermomicrobiales bacterium]